MHRLHAPLVLETQSLFGSDLHDGFEWVLAESPGPVVNVTNTSQLTAAIAAATGGEIIDGGGNTFVLSGQMTLPDVPSLTTIQDCVITSGRIYKDNDGPWRLRNCDISSGTPEDNVKGEVGGFYDIDGCDIHNAPKQGILLYPHSDVVIRNSRVRNNGSTANQDHGAYTGEGSRVLIYNTAFYNNQAYQIQYYPHYHGGLIVCCTMYGGVTRGGIVFGSENVDVASDLRVVGCVAVNSQTFGYEQFQTVSNITIEDCLGWNNTSGDLDTFTSDVTVTGFVHGNPLFVNAAGGDFTPGTGSAATGIIDPSLYPLVPATDINGTARTVANVAAGAFAAA